MNEHGLTLPVSSGVPILPHQRTRLVAFPVHGALDVEKIVISNAGTLNGAGDWIINDIEVDGRSQLIQKDLQGVFFGANGPSRGRYATARLLFSGLDVVECGHELAVTVTYVGGNSRGCPFFGSAIGSRPAQNPTVLPITSREPIRDRTTMTVVLRMENAPFRLERLKIKDNENSWLIEDVRVEGQSRLFEQPFEQRRPNEFRGIDAFDIGSSRMLDPFLVNQRIEIDVRYLGRDSLPFSALLEGTVIRDDYTVPPSNLRVFVEAPGYGAGDVVIATCNWRAPAVSNNAP